MKRQLVVALGLLLAGGGFASAGDSFKSPGKQLKRSGDEIVVAGHYIHTGTKVVTWLDAGGYDATSPRCAFTKRALPTAPAKGCNTPSRIGSGRFLNAPRAPNVKPGTTRGDLETLRSQVDAVVVHYDEAYTSANCFKVLQDVRGLSCQFLLDLDGTIYQTCDLRERARHAGIANDRSVGIEIAHAGTLNKSRRAHYTSDEKGTVFTVPKGVHRGNLPPGSFRLASKLTFKGTIQGRELEQYDFTKPQYDALAHLLAALSKIFPLVRLKAPRTANGGVVPHVLPTAQLAAFKGVIGHYHVSKAKVDPGPAFQWDRVLKRARRLAR